MLQACGACTSQRALVLVATALAQLDAAKQAALLEVSRVALAVFVRCQQNAHTHQHTRTPVAPCACAAFQGALDELQASQAAEAELFAAQQAATKEPAQRPGSAHHLKPGRPHLLSRRAHSVTLTAPPLHAGAASSRQPALFAAYCKPCGAGVALAINKTSMELPGTCCGAWQDGQHTCMCAAGMLTHPHLVFAALQALVQRCRWAPG
jgi:hypothetical protein